MPRQNALRRGQLVASLFHGAWRERTSPLLGVSERALSEIAPLVLRSGGAALAWHRVRQSHLAGSRAAHTLRQGYRLHALQAAVHDEVVETTLTTLSEAEVTPILAKGWAVARRYPDAALRPYGDVDLYVARDELTRARRALSQPHAIDLHAEIEELDDRTFEDLVRRATPIPIGSTEVRLLSDEDHLRLLCLHALRHGIARPIWLCDLGALFEARDESFDWSYFLAGDPTRTSYVAAALVLASHVVGLRLDGTPLQDLELPGWVTPSLLRTWGRGWSHREPVRTLLRSPRALLREAPRHWPSALEAITTLGRRLRGAPPWTAQVRLLVNRAVRRRRAA